MGVNPVYRRYSGKREVGAHKEILPTVAAARDYALRSHRTSRLPVEFALTKHELRMLERGASLVLVIDHGGPDSTAVVVSVTG